IDGDRSKKGRQRKHGRDCAANRVKDKSSSLTVLIPLHIEHALYGRRWFRKWDKTQLSNGPPYGGPLSCLASDAVQGHGRRCTGSLSWRTRAGFAEYRPTASRRYRLCTDSRFLQNGKLRYLWLRAACPNSGRWPSGRPIRLLCPEVL